MNGLVMLVLLGIGAVGGYCFAALMAAADKPMPRPRPWDDTLYRHARDWDNRS